jgi:hypothetical protein
MFKKRWTCPVVCAAGLLALLVLGLGDSRARENDRWGGAPPPPVSNKFGLFVEGGVQIAWSGDWQEKRLQPYLVQIRRASWSGFFWQINTSRKTVEKATNTNFGELPNSRKTLNVTVKVDPPIDSPPSFSLQFPDAYLAYYTGQAKAGVYARVDYGEAPTQISDGRYLEVKRLQSYLYHVRVKPPSGVPGPTWFWMVNTSRKLVERIENGQFGQVGGDHKPTAMTVTVTGNPESPASFGLKFSQIYLWYEK